MAGRNVKITEEKRRVVDKILFSGYVQLACTLQMGQSWLMYSVPIFEDGLYQFGYG